MANNNKMNILEAIKQLRDDLKLWVANNLRTKVDKEDGKGLSSNDFTTEEKEKLASIGSGFDVWDTVTGNGTLEVNAAKEGSALEVTLSSDTYNDFSSINVILTGVNGTQQAMASPGGLVSELLAETEFSLSLSSTLESFNAENIVISCKYKLDANDAFHDYILHLDIEEDDDTILPKDYFDVDDTLTVSGVAADSKKTGDEIASLNALIGGSPVAEQIAEAIVEVYVQSDEPENAITGSIWVDTGESGLSNPEEDVTEATTSIYVVDAGTSDMGTIDFSQYKVGDVLLITTS